MTIIISVSCMQRTKGVPIVVVWGIGSLIVPNWRPYKRNKWITLARRTTLHHLQPTGNIGEDNVPVFAMCSDIMITVYKNFI